MKQSNGSIGATTAELELAVAKWFDPRRVVIVPNVSWGLGVHECDLLVLSKSGYAYEIEIKVSRQDLRADSRKRHKHQSLKIKRLWFAMPEYLVDSMDCVPPHAGILLIDSSGEIRVVRKPQDNAGARKLSDDERFNLVRLGTLRIWDLKQHLLDIKKP